MNILNILSKKILNKFINFNELRVRIKIDLSLSHKLNIEPILRLLLSKIYRREYLEYSFTKKPYINLIICFEIILPLKTSRSTASNSGPKFQFLLSIFFDM